MVRGQGADIRKGPPKADSEGLQLDSGAELGNVAARQRARRGNLRKRKRRPTTEAEKKAQAEQNHPNAVCAPVRGVHFSVNALRHISQISRCFCQSSFLSR